MEGTLKVPDPEMAKMMGSMVIVQDTLKIQDLEMEGKKGSIMTGPGMGVMKVQGTGKERMMGGIQRAVQDMVTLGDTWKVRDTLITVILRDRDTALEDQDLAVVEEMETAGTPSHHVIEMIVVDIMVGEAPDIVGKMVVDTVKGRVLSIGWKIQ